MNITININDPSIWNQSNRGINQAPNPCLNCINNPLNNPFATGICHCVLPSMYNVTY